MHFGDNPTQLYCYYINPEFPGINPEFPGINPGLNWYEKEKKLKRTSESSDILRKDSPRFDEKNQWKKRKKEN